MLATRLSNSLRTWLDRETFTISVRASLKWLLSLALKNKTVTPASQAQIAILDYLVNLDFFQQQPWGESQKRKGSSHSGMTEASLLLYMWQCCMQIQKDEALNTMLWPLSWVLGTPSPAPCFFNLGPFVQPSLHWQCWKLNNQNLTTCNGLWKITLEDRRKRSHSLNKRSLGSQRKKGIWSMAERILLSFLESKSKGRENCSTCKILLL